MDAQPEDPKNTQTSQPNNANPDPDLGIATEQTEQTASPAPQATYNSPAATTVPAKDKTRQEDGSSDEYISNPFLNSVRGLVLTLKVNPVSAILAGLVGILLFIVDYILMIVLGGVFASSNILLGLIIIFALSLLYLVPVGAYYVIAGNSARQQQVTTGEAYSQAFKRLLPLIGLGIVGGLMITAGFLLFIVPGIILLARSSLSGLIMFEEDLGPIKALKRSFSLTKGHVNEMLGSLFAGMFLGGYYSLLFGAISVSPLVGRYHDLRQLQESGAPKPKVHWLNYSWLAAFLLIVLPMLAVFIIAASSGVQDKVDENTPSNSSSSSESDFYNY